MVNSNNALSGGIKNTESLPDLTIDYEPFSTKIVHHSTLWCPKDMDKLLTETNTDETEKKKKIEVTQQLDTDRNPTTVN